MDHRREIGGSGNTEEGMVSSFLSLGTIEVSSRGSEEHWFHVLKEEPGRTAERKEIGQSS